MAHKMRRCLRIAYDSQFSSQFSMKCLTRRTFATSRCCSQQPAERERYSSPSIQDGTRIRKYKYTPRSEQVVSRPNRSQQGDRDRAVTPRSEVDVLIDNEPHSFSAVLLRDLCECPSCVDSSTKQKFFSTADIPSDITARAVAPTNKGTSILWDHDLPGFGSDHTTEISSEVLRNLAKHGFATLPDSPEQQVLWDAKMFGKVEDIDYEAYMQDDEVLYQALQLLHTHGLLFVSNVPDSANSVSTVGERIGAIKNTFYGYTWDVRSVPEAKNVAYTSQDLGFHMDLLYMHQPPHLQLLHCIRSSARGGASLFADSYRAAQELFESNPQAFRALANLGATFHYNHPTSHLYRQQRPVFEMKPLWNRTLKSNSVEMFSKNSESKNSNKPAVSGSAKIINYLNHVSWSPPFQGPFSLIDPPRGRVQSNFSPRSKLNDKINDWHAAALEYSQLIHRPEGIYERLMRPGECVIFDNRRVLHARKAFEVGDAGTERWLRGAYLDKDPYLSKLRVLQKRFGNAVDAAIVP